MKKWSIAAVAFSVLALLAWSGGRLSTAVARFMGVVDGARDDGGSEQWIEEQRPPLPARDPAETPWAPSDQDYDRVQGVPEVREEATPRATDYLNDGDEMRPVDATAEELAAELEAQATEAPGGEE